MAPPRATGTTHVAHPDLKPAAGIPCGTFVSTPHIFCIPRNAWYSVGRIFPSIWHKKSQTRGSRSFPQPHTEALLKIRKRYILTGLALMLVAGFALNLLGTYSHNRHLQWLGILAGLLPVLAVASWCARNLWRHHLIAVSRKEHLREMEDFIQCSGATHLALPPLAKPRS